MNASARDDLTRILADLVVTNHRLTRVAAQVTGSTESPAIWRTLSVLQAHGQSRLGELAAYSRVTQPTMTNIVAKLVERDWVRRVPDLDDARAMRIDATASGLAALDDWRDQLARALTPLFANLTAAEQSTLEQAVAILNSRIHLSNMDATISPAAQTPPDSETPTTPTTKGAHERNDER